MLEENFVFDEKSKRLKPVSNICSYCSRVKNDIEDSNFYVKLHKEKKRLNYVVYRNVEFSSFEIGLPRCTSCKTIHEKMELGSKLIFVGILVVLTFGLLSFSKEIPSGFTTLIILIDFFAVILYFAGNSSFKYFLPITYLERRLIKKHKILIAGDSIKGDKTIEGFLKNGWTLDQPTP